MRSLWLVAVGGAIGAVARATVATTIHSRWPSTLPLGTIIVNISGCLILGLLSGVLESRPDVSPVWRAFGAVGVLGAYTTFSTFEFETLSLIERGHLTAALANVALSLLAGLAAVWAGQAVGRTL
ncbi:MAG: fluoride efflux transporter CrcB [Acidobacteria bacterium]|nr:fluoride efflux transporter CrcB [Acidobacteriota bacterium]